MLTHVLFVLGRCSDPEGENISHIFFPLRWSAYENERQLNDPTYPDYAATHEPTEKDEAKLDRWLNYVDEKLGGKNHVQRDVFRFAVMKDIHPADEWVGVGSLSLH